MRLVNIGFCLFLIVTVLCSTANARDLVVGLPMLEPYAAEREGEVSGMHVDLIKAVFRHMGENYTIRVIPQNRIVHEFVIGALDVTVMANVAPILFRVGYLTKGYLSYDQIALMERWHNPVQVKAPFPTINTSMAVIRGVSPKSKYLERHEVTWVNSREQLLKMLFSGRVKYIVAEEGVTYSFARRRNFPSLVKVLPLGKQSFHTVFSKLRLDGDAELLGRRFDASLEQIIQQGEWRIIIDRYSPAL